MALQRLGATGLGLRRRSNGVEKGNAMDTTILLLALLLALQLATELARKLR
jgi:hypothetical protein